MSEMIRSQSKCNYASSEYAESIWGKYVYIYEGKGRLELSHRSLTLEGCPLAMEIPFQAITSIRLSQFSTLAKPLGLNRLTVNYWMNDRERTIHLVPNESALDPTWVTNDLVTSWHQTLDKIPELADRVEPRAEAHIGENTGHRFTKDTLALGLLVIPLIIVGLAGLIFCYS